MRATTDTPVSGVQEVWFFVGKPVNNAPPPNVALIPGKPGETAGEWTTSVPLGDGLTPVDVSVQVVSRTKLSGFATQMVERADPAELAKPLPEKVKGQVTEGPLPQAGLAVTLFDDKGKEKAKAKTKDDGGFEFADLPPGKYRLFAAKSSTGREKSLPVELKAGEEKMVTLGLLLK